MGLVTRELDGYFVQHEQCNSFCFISSGYSPFLVLLMRNMQTPSELIILRDSALCQHSLTVALWQECWEGRLLVLPQTDCGRQLRGYQLSRVVLGIGIGRPGFPPGISPWLPQLMNSLKLKFSHHNKHFRAQVSSGLFKRNLQKTMSFEQTLIWQDTQPTSLLAALHDAQLTGATWIDRERRLLETAKAWGMLEGTLWNSGLWTSPGNCISRNVISYF